MFRIFCKYVKDSYNILVINCRVIQAGYKPESAGEYTRGSFLWLRQYTMGVGINAGQVDGCPESSSAISAKAAPP